MIIVTVLRSTDLNDTDFAYGNFKTAWFYHWMNLHKKNVFLPCDSMNDLRFASFWQICVGVLL